MEGFFLHIETDDSDTVTLTQHKNVLYYVTQSTLVQKVDISQPSPQHESEGYEKCFVLTCITFHMECKNK